MVLYKYKTIENNFATDKVEPKWNHFIKLIAVRQTPIFEQRVEYFVAYDVLKICVKVDFPQNLWKIIEKFSGFFYTCFVR